MQEYQQNYSIIDLQSSGGKEHGVALEIVSLRPQEFQVLRNRNFYRYGYTTRSPNALSGKIGFNMLQFRIDVDNFKLRKKQAKILRRFDSFLKGDQKSNTKDKKDNKKNENQMKELIIEHKEEVATVQLNLEKALQMIKEGEHGVDLCPYGVKPGQIFIGVKSIFMDNSHVGVYENLLLEKFIVCSGLDDQLENYKFVNESQSAQDNSKNKKSKPGFVSKICKVETNKYFVFFENRQFRIEINQLYNQSNIQENVDNLNKDNLSKEKQKELREKLRKYFGVTDPK